MTCAAYAFIGWVGAVVISAVILMVGDRIWRYGTRRRETSVTGPGTTHVANDTSAAGYDRGVAD